MKGNQFSAKRLFAVLNSLDPGKRAAIEAESHNHGGKISAAMRAKWPELWQKVVEPLPPKHQNQLKENKQ